MDFLQKRANPYVTGPFIYSYNLSPKSSSFIYYLTCVLNRFINLRAHSAQSFAFCSLSLSPLNALTVPVVSKHATIHRNSHSHVQWCSTTERTSCFLLTLRRTRRRRRQWNHAAAHKLYFTHSLNSTVHHKSRDGLPIVRENHFLRQ